MAGPPRAAQTYQQERSLGGLKQSPTPYAQANGGISTLDVPDLGRFCVIGSYSLWSGAGSPHGRVTRLGGTAGGAAEVLAEWSIGSESGGDIEANQKVSSKSS